MKNWALTNLANISHQKKILNLVLQKSLFTGCIFQFSFFDEHIYPPIQINKIGKNQDKASVSFFSIDCKTVRIFAYSSSREQSNERSGMRLKTACEARALCARKTLTPRFTDVFTDFEKKTDCFAVYFFYRLVDTIDINQIRFIDFY